MNAIFNHLWQSTVFAAVIALAALALHRNSPRLRYWLWLATSLKFLIPFSLLVATGSRIQLPPDTPSLHAVTVQQISTYFAPIVVTPARGTIPWMEPLSAIWLLGVFFLVIRWFRRWLTLHAVARRATRLPLFCSVPVLSSPTAIEPGVFGVFRPVLLLPQGITENLTTEQFDAIVAHECRHIQYRDNLTAALHMCVETLFWFHPMVWYIGARLTDERERDCDEAVLRKGNPAAEYARGIVSVCKTYVESPMACAAGITGSDLKRRIREIMTWRGSLPVSARGRVMLAAATIAAVSIPFAIGILRAKTLPPAPAYGYEAVSIHKSEPGQTKAGFGPGPQGGLRSMNTSVMMLLTFAYSVRDYQIVGAPGWVLSDNYDITLTPDKAEAPLGPDPTLNAVLAGQGRNQQRLQAVLRDRFGLVLRSETHELPIYRLTPAKNGARLTVHPEGGAQSILHRNGPGHLEAVGIPIKMLAESLSRDLGRPVTDESGLAGQYDFKLDWSPDLASSPDHPADITGPSVFTAITDQLGLRLESTKGPVQVYVVEKITQPTEN